LDADLNLKQVFKPHTAEVTALAYERDGEILATGVSRFPFHFLLKFHDLPFNSAYLTMSYLVKLNF
jgi:hypothetical protein